MVLPSSVYTALVFTPTNWRVAIVKTAISAAIKRLIPLTQAPLYVVSEGGRAWGARFGAPSGGARTHAGGVPERISR